MKKIILFIIFALFLLGASSALETNCTNEIDDDNDGIPDTEDVLPEDQEQDGKPDWHKKK